MAALNWAYREAAARQSAGDQARRDAQREASSASSADGKSTERERDAEALGSGAMTGAPMQADVHGQAASFTSVLFGSQQAGGEAGKLASDQPSARAATLAALRQEVVHARSDVAGSRAESGGTRRATNSSQSQRGAAGLPAGVSYDRARATQPLAVPERADRSSTISFFGRRRRVIGALIAASTCTASCFPWSTAASPPHDVPALAPWVAWLLIGLAAATTMAVFVVRPRPHATSSRPSRCGSACSARRTSGRSGSAFAGRCRRRSPS